MQTLRRNERTNTSRSNMYSVIATSMMMFHVCFAFNAESSRTEYGYILAEAIQCNDSSTAISTCSGLLDYDIPDSNNSQIPDLSANVAARLYTLLSFRDEKCTEAGTKYLCEASYPFRCGDTYIEVDGKELAATCNASKKNCSSLQPMFRESMFNCSSIASNPDLQHKYPRKFTCSGFPILKDDPYPCKTNYKVFAENATRVNETGGRIVSLHKMLKNSNLSVACENRVADTICKASIPACSKDHSKIVYFYSVQDCRKKVGCVNETNNASFIQEVHSMCDHLPDGNTTKKYLLHKVQDMPELRHRIMNEKTFTTQKNTNTSTSTKTTEKRSVPTGSTTCNEAQITRMNEVVFLVISILFAWMWHEQ